MPPVWKGTAGASFGWYRPGEEDLLTVYGHAGLSKDLMSPIVGAAALNFEGYGGYRGSGDFDGGLRGLFMIPSFRIGAGVDWNIRDNNTDLLLRAEFSTRRGGLFGTGAMLRIDWLPTRSGTLGIGFNYPLWGQNHGETRPQRDAVEMEEPPVQRIAAPANTTLRSSMASLAERATWIARLTTPMIERGGAPLEAFASDLDSLRTHLGAGRGLAVEQREWHDLLDAVFSQAMGAPSGQVTDEGRKLAQAARDALLERVILPYDALLGQRKAKEGLALYGAAARAEFVRWLTVSRPGLPEAPYRAAEFAFQSVVDAVETVREFQERRWEDSRLTWLPFQLALRESDYDSQAELNGLIERATGGRFSDGNQLSYVMNENFQLEFARSVLVARDYHVLWIHDYRGVNATGKPDELGFAQTAEVYLKALIDRVRAYDSVGTIPQYFIFLDQNYFEANQTRIWFRILEDPLRHKLSLPSGYERMEQRMAQVQDELRRAVSESRLLQAERQQYGDKWLRKRLQVHINITNPADFSFVGNHLAGIIPVPDNMIRDHRKIAFYDITEADPNVGQAMYTGMGIGEHYAGANWEDRAVIVRGPSALTVKLAARRLLEQQGFSAEEIPLPFRPLPFGERYKAQADSVTVALTGFAPGWTGSALELHNETGYATKQINVEKAILYSLMSPGSVIKIPDSLWQSWLYGSLLAGSALRGCKVLIIAPSLASAPSSAPPTMARAHGLLSALLSFQNGLKEELSHAGGVLRVGLYAPQSGVSDLSRRVHQVLELKASFLADVYHPNPAITAEMRRIDTTLREAGDTVQYLVAVDSAEKPKLHLKANFFITAGTWQKLSVLPEWGPVLRQYFMYLAKGEGDPRARGEIRSAPPEMIRAFHGLAQGLSRTITREEADASLTYFTVGSTNMNYRSMYLDGEVQITTTGWNTLPGLVDFFLLVGLTEWPETQEELDKLLPPPGGTTKSMARLLRNLL
jgi:phosphatidylserine/phosphatidylglycerophosphate/cardiolipin synthase-like enzyme